MKLTSSEEYGLRCLLQIARADLDGSGSLSIREISTAEGISQEYAAKLVQVLRRAGVVESRRGAHGGYAMQRSPHEVSAWEVLHALDSPLYGTSFCQGHSGKVEACVHAGSSCSIRVLWQWMDGALDTVLQRVTIADLLGDQLGTKLPSMEPAAPRCEACAQAGTVSGVPA